MTDALSAGVHAVLDRRLAAVSGAPLAVGLSGGGDSRALALIAADWAAAHGRRLLVLTIDHGLNPASAAWTAQCAALAARLGAPFHALAWTGDKPARGLPAAARLARHRLLAEAARGLGARVVLLGHTASDLAEAAAMRAEGSTTPSPREWAPSPVWPEGRGVFLLRPMLGVTRQALRDWLAARGEAWIDDPSNDDLRFARARARAARPEPTPAADLPQDLAGLAAAAQVDAAGVVALPRARLPARLTAAAALCAAGTARPPRADRLARVTTLLQAGRPLVATLAGARIETDGERVLFMREPGEFARRPEAALMLAPGQSAVWDGRFEITAARAAVVAPLAGHAARLPPAQRQALRAIAPKARAALPVLLDGAAAHCPLLEDVAGVAIRSLILDRLLAACGAVEREP
ncbi:tRNA lysidine(34) synthetase TilS [Phenylobacterium sp.]|uniref:tRNA lysidine(34) synthetase TilS n=1 Tax=Phenylobacterium sp. TaxID=1871053 RepID=UPI0028A041D3|nr:tRNA lysidine(34) synthetase TilS [Phenylobacterium sp.]